MTNEITEEQRQEWVRTNFQRANGYLAERGLITNRILTKESRYLAPVVALWKFSLQGLTEKVWVVTGADLPTDHINAELAGTAQEALRHFSLQWQLKAESILNSSAGAAAAEQQKIAETLIRSAEVIYTISNDDAIWKEPENA